MLLRRDQEMMDILGGSYDAEAFQRFVELAVKGFLVVRMRARAVTALVNGMADSGLPCYKFATTLTKLEGRFQLAKDDVAAAKFFKDQVWDATNKLTTIIYDGIQKLQNDIYSDSWK